MGSGVWWSFLLAGVGVLGLYLTTREGGSRRLGYGVGLAVQALWVAYALASGQPGFLLSALAYGAVNVIGLRKLRRPRGLVQVPQPEGPNVFWHAMDLEAESLRRRPPAFAQSFHLPPEGGARDAED